MTVKANDQVTVLGLEKSYGPQNVLVDVNLSVPRGQFLCLLGASGCGKSTLLRILAGLEEPTQGDVQTATDQKRIGFVFQQPNLLPWRRVLDNIGLPLQLRGVKRGDRSRKSLQMMTEVGLRSDDGKKWPRMLSGGMQMRASLARTLVTEPDLLLFDEPFSALDEVLRQRLNEDLRLWHEAKRWTTLFVTHNVSEAVFLADRILVLRNTRDGQASIAADLENPIRPSTRMPNQLRESEDYLMQVVRVSQKLREVSV